MRIDFAHYEKLRQQRLISMTRHPTFPYWILNYTPICQYERAWTGETLLCRGLIVDDLGNVIARPFPKFFNLEEHLSGTLPVSALNWQLPFLVTEKMDGSLGILYPTPNGPKMATRGSFISEQSQRANLWWRQRHSAFTPIPGCTYLFEIIYPENRIVVDYQGRQEIVLLDILQIETGLSLGREQVQIEAERLGCSVVPAYAGFSAQDLLQGNLPDEPNREGVVVAFTDGNRVKIKLDEYKRLHRVLTGVTATTVWEMLAQQQSMESLLDRVPDEFNQWLQRTIQQLQSAYQSEWERAENCLVMIREKLQLIYVNEPIPRKVWAEHILSFGRDSGLLFRLLDGKDPAELIWRSIKPKVDSPFRSDDMNPEGD